MTVQYEEKIMTIAQIKEKQIQTKKETRKVKKRNNPTLFSFKNLLPPKKERPSDSSLVVGSVKKQST